MFSGVAIGVAMSVGTAWVSELSTRAGDRPGVGTRRSALWMSAGLGAGPASAGLLAHFATPALTMPFVVHALLCVPAILLVSEARWAETRPRAGERLRLVHLRVPAARHRRFVRVVLPIAPWVFGSAGIAYAIVPQVAALGHWFSYPVMLAAVAVIAAASAAVCATGSAKHLPTPV